MRGHAPSETFEVETKIGAIIFPHGKYICPRFSSFPRRIPGSVFVSDTAPLKERGQCAPELWESEVKQRAERGEAEGPTALADGMNYSTLGCTPPDTTVADAWDCIQLTTNVEPDRVLGSEITQSTGVTITYCRSRDRDDGSGRQCDWGWEGGGGTSVEQAEPVQGQTPERQRKGRVRERRQRGGDTSRQRGEGDAHRRRYASPLPLPPPPPLKRHAQATKQMQRGQVNPPPPKKKKNLLPNANEARKMAAEERGCYTRAGIDRLLPIRIAAACVF